MVRTLWRTPSLKAADGLGLSYDTHPLKSVLADFRPALKSEEADIGLIGSMMPETNIQNQN
jgi:hypothetical protein